MGVHGGWAICPESGRSHHATYTLATPVAGEAGGTRLTFVLDHSSRFDQHVLGQFRILVTGAEKPNDGLVLPAGVLGALRTPAEGRTAEQKSALAAYYRTVAPELAEPRAKLAALRAPGAAFPPVVPVGKTSDVEVLIGRSAGFMGEVTLSVEGYSAGVDPATKLPLTIAKI